MNDLCPLQVKVKDFGFAIFLDPNSVPEETMRLQVGTVYFMVPEIITNKGHGQAVDTLAFGVLLCTTMTGRLPIPGGNIAEHMRNVVIGSPLFPPLTRPDISDDAKGVGRGLLNLDPNK